MPGENEEAEGGQKERPGLGTGDPIMSNKLPVTYKTWVDRSSSTRILNNSSNKAKHEGKSVSTLSSINSHLYSITKDFRKSILKNGPNNNLSGQNFYSLINI